MVSDGAEKIIQARSALSELLARIPASWPEKQYQATKKKINDALNQSAAIAVGPLSISPESVEQLKQTENQIRNTSKRLQESHRTLEQEINNTHAHLVSEKLSKGISPAQLLKDFLKNKADAVSPAEDKISGKLNTLLAEILALKNSGAWDAMMQKCENIRKETGASRRRALYESLVLECSERLQHLRGVERWRQEMEELIDSAAHLRGTVVDQVVENLKSIVRAGKIIDMEPLRSSLTQAISAEEKRQMREHRRRAVFDSFAALGYEIEEGKMETALVQAGKIHIRKPDNRDYAIEVVSNEDFSMVQTAMVRFGDSDESTQQQRLRDKEQEETWCGDHASLQAELEKQGINARFKLKIPAGEKPVRVIVDASRKRRGDSSQRMPGGKTMKR